MRNKRFPSSGDIIKLKAKFLYEDIYKSDEWLHANIALRFSFSSSWFAGASANEEAARQYVAE